MSMHRLQKKQQAALERRNTEERELVRRIGNRIGYGRTMQLCEELWREEMEKMGHPGSERTLGTCARFLVACPCDDVVQCDWCCGSGRVTERVARAMREHDAAE